MFAPPYVLLDLQQKNKQAVWYDLFILLQFGGIICQWLKRPIPSLNHYARERVECGEYDTDHPYHYQQIEEIRENYHRSTCAVDKIDYRVIDDTVEITRIIRRLDMGN